MREVKLLAGDGCWKIERISDEMFMRRQDVCQQVLFPIVVGGGRIALVKRTYRYWRPDDHNDLHIYREIP